MDIGCKRVGDFISSEDQPPLKKQKSADPTKEELSAEQETLRTEEVGINFFNVLNYDCLSQIAFHLPSERDILTFERLCSQARSYTALAYKTLAKLRFLDFDWSLQEQTSGFQRASYWDRRLLCCYIASVEKITAKNAPSYQELKKLYDRFEEVMGRRPDPMGSFICKSLNSLLKPNTKIFEIQPNYSKATAENLLLQGLSYLFEYKTLNTEEEASEKVKLRQKAFISLNEAIKKGATCASFLAQQILFCNYKQDQFYYNLALSSMNQGDERGLAIFLKNYPSKAEELYNAGLSSPPVIAALALQKAPQEKSTLLKEAIESYKDCAVPPHVYVNMGIALYQLKAFKEAAIYYAKAIVAYETQKIEVPAFVYGDMGYSQLHLKAFKEAAIYYAKAIVAYETQKKEVPAVVYGNMASTQFRLNAFKEAENYLAKAIAAYETQKKEVPPQVYIYMAEVQSKLLTLRMKASE